MVIYNVTSKVTHAIAASWLQWMKEEHIPEVIGTGCFTHATILRLIETDDTEGPTYAIQYHAPDKAAYNLYVQQFAEAMRQKASSRWGQQYIAFRSVLEVVN